MRDGDGDPVRRWRRDLLTEEGTTASFDTVETPLVVSIDVTGDGDESPALMTRVGQEVYGVGGSPQGVIFSTTFVAPEAGKQRFAADLLFLPYVAYWVNLDGGSIALVVSGERVAEHSSGMVGITTSALVEDETRTRAERARIDVVAPALAGEDRLAFKTLREFPTANSTPALFIDTVRVAPAAMTAAAVPLPPAAVLLASGLTLAGWFARRRPR